MMAGIACVSMASAIFAGQYFLKQWGLWNRKIKAVFLITSVLIFLCGGFLMEKYGYHPLKIFRYWILMYGLLLLGIFDGDRKRIPNRALLLLLAVRTCFLVVECMVFPEFWMEIVLSACTGLVGGGGRTSHKKNIFENRAAVCAVSGRGDHTHIAGGVLERV